MGKSMEVVFGKNTGVTMLVGYAMRIASTRRAIKVEETTRMHLDSTWSEGSRDTYQAVAFTHVGGKDVIFISGDATQALPVQHSPFSFDGQMGARAPVYELVPGVAVVQHVTFRGKDLGYRLHLHPTDYAILVSDAQACQIHDECKQNPEMGKACAARGDHRPDERSRRILACYRGLKSGPYRKEALAGLKCSEEDVSRMVAAGWLSKNKAGAVAITPEGRTLCADERVS